MKKDIDKLVEKIYNDNADKLGTMAITEYKRGAFDMAKVLMDKDKKINSNVKTFNVDMTVETNLKLFSVALVLTGNEKKNNIPFYKIVSRHSIIIAISEEEATGKAIKLEIENSDKDLGMGVTHSTAIEIKQDIFETLIKKSK